MENTSAGAVTNVSNFERNYLLHQKHLKLKGLQPKTIEAYTPRHSPRRSVLRPSDRQSERDRPDGLLHRPARDALLEFGQARPVWAEVLPRACAEEALGGARI